MATNVALRFSFQVPTFNAKGQLTGTTHKHFVLHDAVSEIDFKGCFNFDANKVAALFEEKVRIHMIAKNQVPSELQHLVKKTGLSTTRHEHATRIDPHSASWV